MVLVPTVWALAAAGFLIIRIWPIWSERNSGCDTYNILLCAEALRRQRSLPIRLPSLFILEEDDQWYPPGFLILCALIPERWLKRRFWLVNHLVDLLHISLAFAVLATAGLAVPAAAAMLVYAALAPLLMEFSTLNTRPLGLLLLSMFLLAAEAAMTAPAWAIVAGVAGILLFYSHKLSLQQLWFTLPALAVATADWRWAAWLAGIYVLSFLAWPRGFRRIIGGQNAIVAFWDRNWRQLGAHTVRQSPVYGDGTTRTDFYAIDGVLGVIRLARDALYQNFFALPVAAFALARPWPGAHDMFLLTWFLSVYVWAALIHLLLPLRRIGLARQYIKFALLPSALYLVPASMELDSAWSWALLGSCVGLAAWRYFSAATDTRRQSSGQTGVASPDLLVLVERLKLDPAARVMCLPVHLCDLVAYKARRPVYWGTHSHVFDERLERFFPVLKTPLQDYVADGALTHLLLDTRYAGAAELGLPRSDCVAKSGDYVLYRLSAVYSYQPAHEKASIAAPAKVRIER